MKRTVFSLAGLLLAGSVLLCACGIRKTTELTPEPTPSAEAVQEAEIVNDAPEAVPEESEEEAEPAPVVKELPPKPDINIYSWEYILANSFNSIGEYVPPYSSFDGQGINQNILEPAMEFFQAARNAGFQVWCSVAYRNYEFLDSHYLSYRFNVAQDAVSAANSRLAPGLDEHQTGLAIDFTDRYDYSAWYGDFDDGYMKDTELYQWLVEHCTEYGFILRYPEGKEEFYGVACNHPAHFRYVGKEAAEYMTANDLCLEEFIMLYDESLVFLPKP